MIFQIYFLLRTILNSLIKFISYQTSISIELDDDEFIEFKPGTRNE